MQPLALKPILKRIRWGGRRLGEVLGKPIGPEADYAESWEVVDHGDDQSVVEGGEWDGWTLRRLVRERNTELFGRHAGRDQFPLLVKFLDATDRLSVQVHPDDARAKQFDPAENGKTEVWVILDAEPGGRLYVGLRPGVDAESLRAALREEAVEECLHAFEVSAGDCIFVPAGSVHAIGEGILLAEIQQSSDLTFRLDDWGRLDADGRPRPLHIDEALRCIDFDRGPVHPLQPQPVPGADHSVEELVRCEHFVIRRRRPQQEFRFPPDDRCHVWMMLSGGAQVVSDSAAHEMPLGRTLLLPAERPSIHVTPAPGCCLLDAFLP